MAIPDPTPTPSSTPEPTVTPVASPLLTPTPTPTPTPSPMAAVVNQNPPSINTQVKIGDQHQVSLNAQVFGRPWQESIKK